MIIVLNNKCNLNKDEFKDYLNSLNKIDTQHTLILTPTFLNIPEFSSNKILLGAQNVGSFENGAHTGEVCAEQLKSYGVKYCIVGHSERRKDQKETNEDIKNKIEQLTSHNIVPILCIGETKEQRQENIYKDILIEQLDSVLKQLSPNIRREVIIAYEPIWSIGSGIIPNNKEIEEVNLLIKSYYNNEILYGGSVNENNIEELKKCSSIDGYLLGGLSLKPANLQEFVNKL